MRYYCYILLTVLIWIPTALVTLLISAVSVLFKDDLECLITLESMVLNPHLIIASLRLDEHTTIILYTLPDLCVDVSSVMEHLYNMDKRSSFDAITPYSGLQGHLRLFEDLDRQGLLNDYQKAILLDPDGWFWTMVNAELILIDSEPYDYQLPNF